MKTCSKCKTEKDESLFSKDQAQCKDCIKEYNKQYRINNKEELKEYKKQYYIENIEEIKEYYIEHKEEKKQYRIEHKEEKREYDKQYAIDNKEEIKEYDKQYNIKNKEKRKEYNKQYKKNKLGADPIFKLRKNVSGSVNKALHRNGSSKNGSSVIKHLAYTIEELKQYLELLFEPWMSWENHGKYNAETWDINDQSTWVWHLDHITPQTHLPYPSMEDDNFKICWALENLRPYSAKKNIEESNNRSQEEITKIKNDIKERLELLK